TRVFGPAGERPLRQRFSKPRTAETRMRFRQKRVANQVMVITGASSGIGLATAREAARRGARVMLVSRDEEDLRRAVLSISGDGGHASYMVADVADLDAMMNVAEWTIREFGGFDT